MREAEARRPDTRFSALSSHITNEWPTPQWLVDLAAAEFGSFDLDPAATPFERESPGVLHRGRRRPGPAMAGPGLVQPAVRQRPGTRQVGAQGRRRGRERERRRRRDAGGSPGWLRLVHRGREAGQPHREAGPVPVAAFRSRGSLPLRAAGIRAGATTLPLPGGHAEVPPVPGVFPGQGGREDLFGRLPKRCRVTVPPVSVTHGGPRDRGPGLGGPVRGPGPGRGIHRRPCFRGFQPARTPSPSGLHPPMPRMPS